VSWTDIPVLEAVAHDGDTVDCLLDLGFDIRFRTHVRVLGVNAPEVDGAEKAAGLAVKGFVDRWLASNRVGLRYDSVGYDKFGGRTVGRLRGGAFELGAVLLLRKLAKPFDGQTKKPAFTPEECAAIVRQLASQSPSP
jgi:hypothetical protein